MHLAQDPVSKVQIDGAPNLTFGCRLVYGLLFDFAKDKHCSYFDVSVTLYICMNVVSEVLAGTT